MLTLLLCFSLVYDKPKSDEVTEAEKKEFFEFLTKLPGKGEFFTGEGVTPAIPYQRVLFALTEKDVKEDMYYRLGALSSALCDNKDGRAYALKNFESMKHPLMKTLWACMLFDRNERKAEIIQHLKKTLDSKEGSTSLSEMAGPNFESFLPLTPRYSLH
ncbi:MAG: hypothetical protein U0798_09970 [Gemmataceae bacterium]